MRFLKPLVMAAALSSAMIAAPAFADGASVVVVSSQRILTETDAGRSMGTQLQTILTTMDGELRPEAQSIQTEEQAIRTAIGSRTPEQIRGDAAIQRRIEALGRRQETFSQRQMTLRRDFEYTQQSAASAFNEQIQPIVREVMQSRGAGVAIDASGTVFVPAADVTSDVISRVNQRVRNFTVTRRSAPAQAASGAAPAASGARH